MSLVVQPNCIPAVMVLMLLVATHLPPKQFIREVWSVNNLAPLLSITGTLPAFTHTLLEGNMSQIPAPPPLCMKPCYV